MEEFREEGKKEGSGGVGRYKISHIGQKDIIEGM